jgi:hypothetical protein
MTSPRTRKTQPSILLRVGRVYRAVAWQRVDQIRYNILLGRPIAQAVSRRLPIAESRVRTRVRSCGICGGQSGTGVGFLQVLRLLLLIRIPPIAPQLTSSSPSIIWGWYNRPNRGHSTNRTQSHPPENIFYSDTKRSVKIGVLMIMKGKLKRLPLAKTKLYSRNEIFDPL